MVLILYAFWILKERRNAELSAIFLGFSRTN